MKKRITELDLANAFEAIIDGSTPDGIQLRFKGVIRELDCERGRPDIVATLTDPSEIRLSFSPRAGQALRSRSAAKLLALIGKEPQYTKTDLVCLSGYSLATVRRSLRVLLDASLIDSVAEGRYQLSQLGTGLLDLDFWAFELKLSDWKRALYQALRYQAFARYSIVVVPESNAKSIEKRQDTFMALGIGVTTVDLDTKKTRVLVPPQSAEPTSRFHYYYALGQFLGAKRTGQVCSD